MIKKLLLILGLVSLALAAWPAWADGTPVQRLGTGVATAVAASPDGAALAVGTSQGVWFLSAATLAPLNFWDTGQWVQSLAYSADGRYLRANDRFYDLAAAAPTLLAPADLKWMPRNCSPGGQRCLQRNIDNLILRDQSTRIDTALLRTGVLFDAAWSPNGNTIYTVGYGGVQAWDANTGTLRQNQTDFFTGSLYSVQWSADGTRVGSGDHAWDVMTGQPAEKVSCSTAHPPVGCGAAHPTIDDLGGDASGNFSQVIVYDAPPATTWHSLQPQNGPTTAVALSADGTRLVTSGSELAQFTCPGLGGRQCQDVVGTTRIWAAQTSKRLGQIPVQFYSVALSPDGRLVLGQTLEGIEVWDWSADQQLWAQPEPIGDTHQPNGLWRFPNLSLSHDLAVSSDGRYVATYANQTSNTIVSLWRVATGEKVATLAGHTTPDPWPSGRLGNAYGVPWYQRVYMSGLAFSPDGRHLAASSLDGTVLVWPVP